ncbi:SAV_2336 N-terminal domain-related protein [Kitasatospora sp. NPDC048365]|uniref:SAV_2336 N-terminal domain-related protein n=1 Tax=Kitasatospora sp. NPDC048365 TaxID=3364050 RepID=UPI00370FA61D
MTPHPPDQSHPPDRPDPGAPPDAVNRLAGLLRALADDGPAPTPREVAELIWLGSLVGGIPPRPPDGDGPTAAMPPAAAPDPPGPAPAEPGPASSPDPAPRPDQPHLYLPTGSGTAPGAHRAAPVRLGTAAVLPRHRALARALRPLRGPVPSPSRSVLDEDATAERLAHDPRWWPVLVPAAERRLDVNLVVDAHGDSAELWEPLSRELLAVLARSGVFRDVRHHRLTDHDGVPVLTTGGRSAPGRAAALGPADGRTATLVLTDGVHPAWGGPALRAALHRWACAGPTALLQTLPERLWPQTALAPEPGRFRTVPGGSHPHFTPYAFAPAPGSAAAVPVPVLGLTPDWLAPWARAVAAPAGFDAAAVLLAPGTPAPADPAPPHRTVTFEEFLAQAQPRVFRLAAYLAVAPLNLAVMRLVQSVLLPDSPPSDLAEIVFSGILHTADQQPAEPLSRAYEFAPGIRERLVATLRRDEADQVVTLVSAHLESHPAGPRFTAALTDPSGPLPLPGTARPWAYAPRRRRRTAPARPLPTGRHFLLTAADADAQGTAEAVRASFNRAGYLTDAIPAQDPISWLQDWTERTDLRATDLVTVYVADGSRADAVLSLARQAPVAYAGADLPHERMHPVFEAAGGVVYFVDAPLNNPAPHGVHPRTMLVHRPSTGAPETSQPSPPSIAAALVAELPVAAADFPAVRVRDFLDRLTRSVADRDGVVLHRLWVPPALTLPFFPPPRPASAATSAAYADAQFRVLDQLSAWLDTVESDRRPRIVTGPPGCGKSTVLERFHLAAGALRTVLLSATAADAEGLWRALAGRLVPSVDDVSEMLGALAALPGLTVVIIDALDEASPDERERIVDEFLRPLATVGIRLVIGTRNGRRRLLGVDAVLLDLGVDHGAFTRAVEAGDRALDRLDFGEAERYYANAHNTAETLEDRSAVATALARLADLAGRAAASRLPSRSEQLRLVEGCFTATAESADFLLDLSNVVHNKRLGDRHTGPLARVFLVLRALIARTGDPTIAVFPALDASTPALLGSEAATFRDWLARGLVEPSRHADQRLVELTELLGIPLISSDRFVAFHADHPWLTYSSHLLLQPALRPNGTVRLVSHTNPSPTAPGPAQAAPVPSTHLGHLVGHRWRCPHDGCTLYTARPRLPRLSGSVPVCEIHDFWLVEAGPRPPTTLLKLLVGGVCALQLTVEQGAETVLGRGDAVDVDLSGLAGVRSQAVSRTHLVLASPEGVLTARSVGRNGSRLRRADPARPGSAPVPWSALPFDRAEPFAPGDEIELAPEVVLRRSGPFFPAELTAARRVTGG